MLTRNLGGPFEDDKVLARTALTTLRQALKVTLYILNMLALWMPALCSQARSPVMLDPANR